MSEDAKLGINEMNTPCLHCLVSLLSVRYVFTILILASENGGIKQHLDILMLHQCYK